MSGLAAGDSLGATSEFLPLSAIPELYCKYKDRGWPFRQVGGGCWQPGEPTDDTDMAMCMVRSFLELGKFDGEDIAQRFVEWMENIPKDIGITTRRTLNCVRAGTSWFEGGLELYRRNPQAWSNGGLMRNGVIPGMAESLEEAFRMTVHHNLITHYAPLPVICCAAQTYLIWEFLKKRNPLEADWLMLFREKFISWLETTDDSICQRWQQIVKADIEQAWEVFNEGHWNPESFNPFEVSYAGRQGYCLLTLEIAVWAAHWSLCDDPFPVPEGFPAEVFEKRGPYVLGWVAMLGNDCDTYAATAGPLIAAIHNGLPEEMTEGLLINDELASL